jgi:disulfide bond formation protein DsbB
MKLSLHRLTHRQFLLLTGLASAGMLGGALIGQYFFDLHPCDLCIKQRWPHGLVAALACAGYFVTGSDKSRRLILMLCAALLLVGAGIASYHTGVEMGILKGPDGCTSDTSGNVSLEELRAQIAGAALVSCSQAMAYIFGLSMAAWNALISVGIALLIAWRVRKSA